MRIVLELIKVSPGKHDSIDYDTLIFKVDVDKRFKLDNVNDYWIFFQTLIAGGARKILVNMKELTSIDSSGIGTLINTAKLLRPKNGDIVLTNVSKEIREIFKVIKLEDFIKIFNIDGEAMNFFRYVE